MHVLFCTQVQALWAQRQQNSKAKEKNAEGHTRELSFTTGPQRELGDALA